MQMHAQFKPFTSRVHKVGSARLAQSTNRVVVCKSDAQKDGNQPVISEDVLARLRYAAAWRLERGTVWRACMCAPVLHKQ